MPLPRTKRVFDGSVILRRIARGAVQGDAVRLQGRSMSVASVVAGAA